MSKNDGGPAFRPFGGMSLRDYFAGQAVIGLVGTSKSVISGPAELTSEFYASFAYELADAMLAERSKP